MSRDFLRKILIRDDQSALEALEEIKIQGGDIELVKKEIERVTGIKVYDIDSALSALSDRVAERVKRVDNKIGEISKGLTDDPKKQELVKSEIEKMVEGELRTEAEDVDSLTKVVEDKEMEAKKAVKIARGMVLENPKEIRLYREEKADNLSDAEKELLKKGFGDKNHSEKEDELLQKGLLNRQKKLAKEVASAAGIENQEQAVMEKFREISPGKAEMAFRHVEIGIGLGRMSSERREAILAENNKINSELGQFKKKIPSNEVTTNVLALGNAGAYWERKKRSWGYSGSSQGGGSFLVRFKMTFYNLGMVLMGRRTTEDGNGFLMTMRGQPASDFVQNSMGLLLNHDLDSSLGRMFAGMAKSGVKNLAGDAALKLAGSALGPAGLAASKVLGFLKKFFGNAGSKLGIGARNGLGSAFDKGGSVLGKAAMGLGALLGSVGFIGTAMASTAVSGAVVGGIAGSFVYQQYIVPGDMISALPNAKRECKSRMEYVNTLDKPMILCGDMSKYNHILAQKIEEVGYQTRCAVVEAVQYLALDFPYFLSYLWGGYYYGDGISENWCGWGNGLDCNSLLVWAYRQGGFAMKKYGRHELWEGFTSDSDYKSRAFETEIIPFSPDNCARIKEVVKPGDLLRTPGKHMAIVIGFDGTKINIAQEGGGRLGLNVCYINPCNGSGAGAGKNRCSTFKFEQLYSMDKFFEYYIEGTSINGFSIKPNSQIRSLKDGSLLEPEEKTSPVNMGDPNNTTPSNGGDED